MTPRELAAEHAFLRERVLHPDGSWVGLSSSHMLALALEGEELTYKGRWPMDMGDLGRCEETYRRAPEHLQERMFPTLVRFRRHVAEGGLYCRGCDNSIRHNSTRYGYCPKCQKEQTVAA